MAGEFLQKSTKEMNLRTGVLKTKTYTSAFRDADTEIAPEAEPGESQSISIRDNTVFGPHFGIMVHPPITRLSRPVDLVGISWPTLHEDAAEGFERCKLVHLR